MANIGWIGFREASDTLELRHIKQMAKKQCITINDLCEGTREGTRRIIDSLGIRIALAELESWNEYERLRRKIHTGFTSTWLYRFLFPHRYKRLYRAYIDARLEIQQEFLCKVLKRTAEAKDK